LTFPEECLSRQNRTPYLASKVSKPSEPASPPFHLLLILPLNKDLFFPSELRIYFQRLILKTSELLWPSNLAHHFPQGFDAQGEPPLLHWLPGPHLLHMAPHWLPQQAGFPSCPLCPEPVGRDFFLFTAFPSSSPGILNTWHSALFKWWRPDAGSVLIFRCQGDQECQVNKEAWPGPRGPLGLTNTNRLKGETQRQPVLGKPGQGCL
jgi:hypothetical protein